MPINFYAVLIAALAAWVTGAVWYGVFGRIWRLALERPINPTAGNRKVPPIGPMIVSFAAELLMAFMMAGLIAHFGTVSIKTGTIVAALSWLAFVLPTITTNYAYPGRKIMLTIIDAGHWLCAMLVIGIILGAFG